MTREQLIRWCAIREKATDALAEAQRHVYDMATLSMSDQGVMGELAKVDNCAMRMQIALADAKDVAIHATREAA